MHHHAMQNHDQSAEHHESARDPVCGMMIDPASAAAEIEHAGTRYFFCSAGCAAKFRADPKRYARPALPQAPTPPATPKPAEPPAVQPAGTVYTCPMHPEIVRDGPGACPICGMALEPRTVTLDQEENPELVDMRRRFSDC